MIDIGFMLLSGFYWMNLITMIVLLIYHDDHTIDDEYWILFAILGVPFTICYFCVTCTNNVYNKSRDSVFPLITVFLIACQTVCNRDFSIDANPLTTFCRSITNINICFKYINKALTIPFSAIAVLFGPIISTMLLVSPYTETYYKQQTIGACILYQLCTIIPSGVFFVSRFIDDKVEKLDGVGFVSFLCYMIYLSHHLERFEISDAVFHVDAILLCIMMNILFTVNVYEFNWTAIFICIAFINYIWNLPFVRGAKFWKYAVWMEGCNIFECIQQVDTGVDTLNVLYSYQHNIMYHMDEYSTHKSHTIFQCFEQHYHWINM
eukprot:167582_1